MRRKVTLKQIAKELDVSISTVSKSLKDSSEISEDTRQKVQAFAKLYNYKPNNIALSLKNKKTKTLFLPFFFFSILFLVSSFFLRNCELFRLVSREVCH